MQKNGRFAPPGWIGTSDETWETARSRNRYLVRKTYAFAKTVPYLDDQCGVDKTFYNFCRKHETLKGQTPAMASGLTDKVWSMREMLERAAEV